MKIVAIGGSAGALSALHELFEATENGGGAAYIVVIHHSPTHHSVLDSLIAGWARMPARVADEGMLVESGCVYVARPGYDLSIAEDVLHLSDRTQDTDHHPVDYLFQSLASSHGPDAAGVVLSGTGNDGTAGAAALKQAGGRVIAQTPTSCAHQGMPTSVIENGLADEQRAPREIPEALAIWFGDDKSNDGALFEEADETAFEAILQLISEQARKDISGYKQSTLRRRTIRRAGLVRAKNLADYLTLLRENPGELDRLAKDMLIGVTAFFRDPEAFDVIAEAVIPALCTDRSPNEAVRIWVVGCSTGEEAYSIAMLVLERLGAPGPGTPRTHIFATDIDSAALDSARAGHYSAATVGGISPERLQRFFVASEDGYTVTKDLRESITFARHNLIGDPPFSKLDLLVCRNVLIYLNPETQSKLVDLFHFVLKPGGYLFLGSTENLGTRSRNFDAVSKAWRIYRRIGAIPSSAAPQLPMTGVSAPRLLPFVRRPVAFEIGALESQEQIYRQWLDNYGPTLLLVNSQFEILYLTGTPWPYLSYPSGEPTFGLFRVVHPALRAVLRTTIHQAQRDQAKTTARLVADANDRLGFQHDIRITVTPFVNQTEAMLVIALDRDPTDTITAPHTATNDPLLQQMELELDATRDDLQRSIVLLRTSNEEAKAASEELLAMNEELQSSNEELESSHEELQALNDELAAANTSLDAKVVELTTTTNDLDNLLRITDIATVFLDADLRIRHFTPACTALLRLIPTDVGRSLGDITSTIDDPDLMSECRRVLLDGIGGEREVHSGEGRWYLRRVQPYRAQDNCISGIVLTFPEITSVIANEMELTKRNQQLEWQADLLRSANVLARDLDDRILFWNHGAEELYGWTSDEAIGQVSHQLLQSQFEIPLAEIQAKLLSQGAWCGRITHFRRSGEPLVVSTTWTLRKDTKGQPWAIVEVNNDVTERVAAESELARYREHLEEVVTQRTAELIEAKQAAEAADRAKSTFVANMSHEIRTPLNAITGMVYLLAKSDPRPEQRERLDKIQTASALLLELIEKILDLSKIEAGKCVIEVEPVRIDAILANVASIMRDRALAKGLNLNSEVPEIPFELAGDATRLQQGLINYATNAIKFTDTGNVTLRAALVEEQRDRVLVRFEVQDTGIGIEPETLSRLFHVFEQANSSTTRKYGGSGLGLVITKKLAQLMGGEAGAESSLNTGSTFWFTAWLKKAASGAPVAEQPSGDPVEQLLLRHYPKRRILLAEDEPVNREIARLMLDDVGQVVDEAKDGVEALQLASENIYDLVLMDCHMPNMDGLEATRRIRALPGYSETPILALTADVLADDRAKSFEAGMSDFISKPVHPDRLYAAIYRWLATKKP